MHVLFAADTVDDIRSGMDESYTYNLSFPKDGKITHYDVTRHVKTEPGMITLTYWTEANKLDINKVENIKTLKIDVQSMFEDESMKVFKRSDSSMPDLHMNYWLEARDGVFTIEFDIDKSEPLESLTFTKFPEPKSVRVNNQEWWQTSLNYTQSGSEISISDIPTGSTEVILYFKGVNKLPIAAFTSNPAQYAGVIEEIKFNGSTSYDPDGVIKSWVWDFGDGNKSNGKTVVHKYPKEGNYTVRLTVRDDTEPDFGESWVEKNITVAFGAEDDFDGDGLRDIWEWNNFGDFDETGTGDPDEDGATNKEEHDAGTDPNNADSKPGEKGKAEEPAGTDLMIIIAIIIIIIVVLVLLMIVFKSKKAKAEAKEVDDEAIAEMEAKIARAKKLGLPTGEMEKLLKQAKEGKPLEVEPVEVEPVKKKKGPGKGKGKGKAGGKPGARGKRM